MSEHRLDKLIVDRPREGSIKTPQGAKKYQQNFEREFSGYEPMNRFKTKHIRDRLAPLYRWLRSKVGQNWDDVYSQLTRELKSNTRSREHLIFHVWRFVERHAIIIAGVPYRKNRQDIPLGSGSWRHREPLYVHPETGRLCVVETPPKPRPQKRNDAIEVDSRHQYRKIDDIWYLVSFKGFRGIRFGDEVFDILLGKPLTYLSAVREYKAPKYAYHKRHCTKKEIKAIKKQLAQ